MTMNFGNVDVGFERSKIAAIKLNWTQGTDVKSRTYTNYFQLSDAKGNLTKGPKIQIKLEHVVKEIRKCLIDPLIDIQSHNFRWTRCSIQPDLEQDKVYSALITPVPGLSKADIPIDLEFVVNVVLAYTSQSRNLIIPGVAEAYTEIYKLLPTDSAKIEGIFTDDFNL